MRDAARNAPVGDASYGEDPTVTALEAEAASLLGFDAAMFCPSGTMANQIAAFTHTDPGQEVVVEEHSHIYGHELAGLARHSALQVRPIDGSPRGVLTPEAITAAIRSRGSNQVETGLVTFENTHNRYGGTAIKPRAIEEAAHAAHEADLPVHLDGARLANAAVAHGITLDQMTTHVDSVMLSLSKGLGAPIGSVLAGSDRFIEQARRARKFFGGGWRQAGIIAAPARIALETIDRLEIDHANAQRLAAGLESLPGIEVNRPETNIVMLDTQGIDRTAHQFLERCGAHGIKGSHFGQYRVRFVTHVDIDSTDITEAIDGLKTICTDLRTTD